MIPNNQKINHNDKKCVDKQFLVAFRLHFSFNYFFILYVNKFDIHKILTVMYAHVGIVK